MFLQFIWRRETAVPCPLYPSGAAGIDIPYPKSGHGTAVSLQLIHLA
ncbi:hypothetical protein QT972_29375 [Microcoleus sp. herbarium7]